MSVRISSWLGSVPYAHAQHVLKGPFQIWNFYTYAEHTRKKPVRMLFQHIRKGTRSASCHFRAKKKYQFFLGPAPSNGPQNGFARIKIITSRAIWTTSPLRVNIDGWSKKRRLKNSWPFNKAVWFQSQGADSPPLPLGAAKAGSLHMNI